MSSSPLTSSSEKKIYYDVFLSFRGEDSRAKFISHLYSSLKNAGFFVFRDDDRIQRGDKISDSLKKSIVCLEELEKIVETSRTNGMVVLPVFYEVDPSEVRNQKGKFGEEFDSLISTKKVDEDTKINWKKVLLEVGGRGGVVIKNSRNESEDIQKIVEMVTGLLDMTELLVADHPVGVESRVQDVIQLFDNLKSKYPLILGIWGMGGIGKTTLAKAVYNKIRHDFDGKSFLPNVGEVWKLDNDKISFQQKLLSDIYKTTEIKIATVDSGKMILQKRLCDKKIFLVIDDVNEMDQLNALCGNRNWFGEGSRIIITTRNEDFLRWLEVNDVYRMKKMVGNESLELFNWHAFKQPIPRDGFTNLSRDVVKYSGGMPLALQVIGSFLFTKKTEAEWKLELEKLKLIPNKEVLKKLRISFDGLSDDDVKNIFLDIAFFFIGMDREDVTEILKDCWHFPEIGINILVQQSLVTVDRKNKIGMHDLLRDMGREIVRKEAEEGSKEPSRLWHYKDVLHELSKDTSTLDVKGLGLKMTGMDSTTSLETKAFEKMNKLRLLQLSGVQLKGDYKYLSRNLRWLSWHGFPLKFTPADFHQQSLVAVDLKYSNLERVWRKSQLLVKLKILNLSHSQNLRVTPDFSNLPNLEKLILKDCPSLSSVSSSIGQLKKIVLINLKDCTGLHELPKSIFKLDSVKTLILSGCMKLHKLEEDIEQMKSLTTLLENTTDMTTKMYDVFLSFKENSDSRNFISHLNTNLIKAGIFTFPRNSKISISLFQAIRQSRISIVVLSTDYVNSKWCMMELERIVEMSRTNGMVVLPVFYDVDPSEARNQTGKFGRAFDSLISTTKVDKNQKRKWKAALSNVCLRTGFAVQKFRNERENIMEIVECVPHLLHKTGSLFADHPMEVESKVQEKEGENQSESKGYSPPHLANDEDNQDSTDGESSHASSFPKETMNETEFPSAIEDDHEVPITGIQISNVAIPTNIPIADELQTGLAAFNIDLENDATAAIESFLSSLGFLSDPIVSTSQIGASSQLTTTVESLVQELRSLAFDEAPFDSLSSILALDQSLDSFKQKLRVHQHLLPASQLEGFTTVLTNLEDIVKTYRGYEQERTLKEHSESEVAKFAIAMIESKNKFNKYQNLISDCKNRDKEIITKVEALKREIKGLEMEQENLNVKKESAIEKMNSEKRVLHSQAASLTAHQSQLRASRDKLSTLVNNLQQCKATYARFKEHPPF